MGKLTTYVRHGMILQVRQENKALEPEGSLEGPKTSEVTFRQRRHGDQ